MFIVAYIFLICKNEYFVNCLFLRGTALGRKSWHSKTSPVSSAWRWWHSWMSDIDKYVYLEVTPWHIYKLWIFLKVKTISPSLTISVLHPFCSSLAVSHLQHFMHLIFLCGTPTSSRLWTFHLKVLGWRDQGKFSFGKDAEIRGKKGYVRNMYIIYIIDILARNPIHLLIRRRSDFPGAFMF